MYKVQDCALPLTLKLYEYASGPLAGYIGDCTNYQLTQKLFAHDRTRWDVSVVQHTVLDSERCEVHGAGVKHVGSIKEGMKVRETDAGHSDLDSAFKMLNRAGKSSAGKPSGAAPSGEPKGSPAAGAIVPEAANADAKKLHEIFADLFMTELDFEADLLRNLQIDQARDDDIDDQLAKISKVEKPAGSKVKKPDASKDSKVAKFDKNLEPHANVIAPTHSLAQLMVHRC